MKLTVLVDGEGTPLGAHLDSALPNDDIAIVDEEEVLTLEPWVTNRFHCDVWTKGGVVAFAKCKAVKK